MHRAERDLCLMMQVISNQKGVVDQEICVGSWTVVLEERSRGVKISLR